MNAQLSERQKLAVEVLQLAKDRLLVSSPFLAPAASLLPFVPSPDALSPLSGTDAKVFYFNADHVLACFAATHEAPVHDYVHTLLHCLFLHPFANPGQNQARWDLACDIAAECVAVELCGPRPGDTSDGAEYARRRICGALQQAPLTAESVFELLKADRFVDEEKAWQQLFCVDDHRFWYERPDVRSTAGAGADAGHADERPNSESESETEPDGARDDAPGEDGVPDEGGEHFKSPKNAWQIAAQSIAASMKHQPASPQSGWGRNLSGLFANLFVAPKSHKKPALDEFLRSFATFEETPRPSSDEFDYALYTYGFALYGDTPIIEPLETRDEKRIREFVIGIDVSGSVWGPTVTRFAQIVQGVLCNEGLFSSAPRIRIIQCDTQIVVEDVIDTPEHMRKWIEGVRIHGGGGTDLRPVFQRVDELVKHGEINDLNGVICLTDGYASFPKCATPYKTAFVLTPDGAQNLMPPWAMTFMLEEDDFRST